MNLNGFIESKDVDVYNFECEKCGYYNTGFNVCNNKSQCPKCEHIHENRPNILKRNEKAVICSDCNEVIPIISENHLRGPFYMCYICENIVASVYENQIYQPLYPLKRSWNIPKADEEIKIENNMYFVNCTDKKSHTIAKILNFMATLEENTFLTFKKDYHKIILVYNNSQAIGYIIWSENEQEIILRQIYLLKEFRGKGNGKLMIKEWVNYFAIAKNGKFGVQAPNSITYNILIKLKLYSHDNNVTNKCYLVS